MSSLVRSLGSWLVAFLRFCVSCPSVRPSVCSGVDNYENENEIRDGGGVGVGIGIGIRGKKRQERKKNKQSSGQVDRQRACLLPLNYLSSSLLLPRLLMDMLTAIRSILSQLTTPTTRSDVLAW